MPTTKEKFIELTGKISLRLAQDATYRERIKPFVPKLVEAGKLLGISFFKLRFQFDEKYKDAAAKRGDPKRVQLYERKIKTMLRKSRNNELLYGLDDSESRLQKLINNPAIFSKYEPKLRAAADLLNLSIVKQGSEKYNPVVLSLLPGIFKDFIPSYQLKAIEGSREHSEILQRLEKIFTGMPKTYDQDGLGNNAIAFLHYFGPSQDWYITEKDMDYDQLQAFGYSNLGDGYEAGYISIVELIDLKLSKAMTLPQLDFFFTPQPIYEVIGGTAHVLDSDNRKQKEKIYAKYKDIDEIDGNANYILVPKSSPAKQVIQQEFRQEFQDEKPISNSLPTGEPILQDVNSEVDEDKFFSVVYRSEANAYANRLKEQAEKTIEKVTAELEAIKGARGLTARRESLESSLSVAKAQKRNAEKFYKKPFEELDIELQNDIKARVQANYERQGGILNEQQKKARIAELEELSLQSFIFEYYPTPVELVDKLIDAADIQAGMTVLEPSAGKGNIADRILERTGIKPDVCEINDMLADTLWLKGYNIVGKDFLQLKDVSYDRIVMNPPFTEGLDRLHIQHAFKLLKPGGKLTAIMSYGGMWKNEPSIIRFREKFVQKYGRFEDLPIGAFSTSEHKTNQQTVFVEMQKPLFEEVKRAETTVHDVETGDYIQSNYYSKDIYQVIAMIPEITMRHIFNGKIEKLELPSMKYKSITEEQANAALELQSATQEADGAEFSRDGIFERGSSRECNLPSRRPEYCSDPELKPVGILEVLPELVRKPAGNHITPSINEILREYQCKGVNLAIESLEKRNGFLLADGTGSGKTMQELAVAERFLRDYADNWVILFTEAEKIIKQSFAGDAEKLGISHLLKPLNKNTVPEPGFIYTIPYYLLDDFIAEDHPVRLNIEKIRQQVRLLKEALVEQNKLVKKMDIPAKQKTALMKENKEKTFNNPAFAKLISLEDEWNSIQDEKMMTVADKCSLVIFDESHNLKNYNEDEILLGMRARRAMAISKYAGSTMFCSATPLDKVDGIFYLNKLGIFKDNEHYQRFLTGIGYSWEEPKRNQNNEVIRRGFWKLDQKFAAEMQLMAIEALFEDATEDGAMIKRELDLVNMRIKINHITVPQEAEDELFAIEEYFANKDDGDGGGSSLDSALVKMEQMRALEPYKIQEVVDITRKEIDEGRSVVIFCALTEEGKGNKKWGNKKAGTLRELEKIFSTMYCSDTIAIVAGTGVKGVTQKQIEADIDKFQAGDKRIVIATLGAGGTGISLDDQHCDQPRTLICMTAPMSANQNVQMLGRIYRANTKSISRAYYVFSETFEVEKWLEQIIASKMAMLNAVVKGQTEKLKFDSIRGKAVVTESDKKHTLFKRKEIDGKDLPAGKPYILKRGLNHFARNKRSSDDEYILIKGHSAEDLRAFEKEFSYFLETNNAEKRSSMNEGSFYLVGYNDEIWNMLINFLKPEIAKYIIAAEQVFHPGDIVKLLEDNTEAFKKTGETGIVVNVRTRTSSVNGMNTYFYTVMFEDGNVANRLEARSLDFAKQAEDSELIPPTYLLDNEKYPDFLEEFKERFKATNKNNADYYPSIDLGSRSVYVYLEAIHPFDNIAHSGDAYLSVYYSPERKISLNIPDYRTLGIRAKRDISWWNLYNETKSKLREAAEMIVKEYYKVNMEKQSGTAEDSQLIELARANGYDIELSEATKYDIPEIEIRNDIPEIGKPNAEPEPEFATERIEHEREAERYERAQAQAVKSAQSTNTTTVEIKSEAKNGFLLDLSNAFDWQKTVVNINKSVKNGYSIVGDFIPKSGKQWYYMNTLYLGHKRKGSDYEYTLFNIDSDGEPNVILKENYTSKYGKPAWATDFWTPIDSFFEAFPAAQNKSRLQGIEEYDPLVFRLLSLVGYQKNTDKTIKILPLNKLRKNLPYLWEAARLLGIRDKFAAQLKTLRLGLEVEKASEQAAKQVCGAGLGSVSVIDDELSEIESIIDYYEKGA